MSDQFKRIKAPESITENGIINLLSEQPHLLAAYFEINGCAYQVMVDTGATISCLPEHGEVLKSSTQRISDANLLVELANGGKEHVNKKTKVRLRPAGSTASPKEAQMYITNGVDHIFGFHALIGLKHLKMFELDINVKDGKILISHQKRIIGREAEALTYSSCGLKVIDNLKHRYDDNNIQRLLNKYKAVFSDLDANPIKGTPMRF